MTSGNANLPTRMNDQSDVNDAAVFFVVILLLLLVAAVLIFGGSWLFPPTVPSPHISG